MHMFEERVYHDDRLFILDLSPAKKGAASVAFKQSRKGVFDKRARSCEHFE
jgi:hypothetical protein